MTLVYHNEYTGKPFVGNLFKSPNCVAHYATHYGNFLYLTFIKNHRDSTPREKTEAIKEIAIANRKCDLWFSVAKSQGRLSEIRETEKTVAKNWQK